MTPASNQQIDPALAHPQPPAQPGLRAKTARLRDLPPGVVRGRHRDLDALHGVGPGLVQQRADQLRQLRQIGGASPELQSPHMLFVVGVDLGQAGQADDPPEGVLQRQGAPTALASRQPDPPILALVAHIVEDAARVVLDQPVGLRLVVERRDSGQVAVGASTLLRAPSPWMITGRRHSRARRIKSALSGSCRPLTLE